MRSAPIAMTGATLSFDRAGTRLLVVQPDAITVVDAAVRRTTRLSTFPDARAAAGGTCTDVGPLIGVHAQFAAATTALYKPKDDPPEQAH